MVYLNSVAELRVTSSEYRYSGDKLLIAEHEGCFFHCLSPSLRTLRVPFYLLPDNLQYKAIDSVVSIFGDVVDDIMYNDENEGEVGRSKKANQYLGVISYVGFTSCTIATREYGNTYANSRDIGI